MTLGARVFPTATDAVWRDVIYKGDDNYCLERTSISDVNVFVPAIEGWRSAKAGTSVDPDNPW